MNFSPEQLEEIREYLSRYVPFLNPSLEPSARRVLNENVLKVVPWFLPGATAATAANYGTMFIADRGYKLIGVSECHGAAAASGTLTIEKCTSGVAADSGTVLLASAFDLTATANVPRFGTLIAAKAQLVLKRGDRLVAKDAGLGANITDEFVQLILVEI